MIDMLRGDDVNQNCTDDKARAEGKEKGKARKRARQGKEKARQGKGKARKRQGKEKARQGKGTARQGTARQGKARHGKARQGKARHGKARHGTARHGKARQGTARQGKARQSKVRKGGYVLHCFALLCCCAPLPFGGEIPPPPFGGLGVLSSLLRERRGLFPKEESVAARHVWLARP